MMLDIYHGFVLSTYGWSFLSAGFGPDGLIMGFSLDPPLMHPKSTTCFWFHIPFSSQKGSVLLGTSDPDADYADEKMFLHGFGQMGSVDGYESLNSFFGNMSDEPRSPGENMMNLALVADAGGSGVASSAGVPSLAAGLSTTMAICIPRILGSFSTDRHRCSGQVKGQTFKAWAHNMAQKKVGPGGLLTPFVWSWGKIAGVAKSWTTTRATPRRRRRLSSRRRRRRSRRRRWR